jgi:hypothetical protein
MFKFFRKRSAARPDERPAFTPELFIYVMIPAAIQPIDRATQFEDPLEIKLKEEQLGTISGGGSQLSAPDSERRQHIEFCGLDVTLKIVIARAPCFGRNCLVWAH